MKQVHLHIWDDTIDPDNPIEELDLNHTETYANMSGPDDNDGYIQFGVETSDGKWLELRIWSDMLPELVAEAERVQRIWEERK